MKKLLIILAASALPATAKAQTQFICNYFYFGSPIATVSLMIADDGTPAAVAQVKLNGTNMREPVTPDVVQADELVHVWLAKNSPNNDVEMIVYKTAQPQGSSVLVNHNVPVAREMWGSCTN